MVLVSLCILWVSECESSGELEDDEKDEELAIVERWVLVGYVFDVCSFPLVIASLFGSPANESAWPCPLLSFKFKRAFSDKCFLPCVSVSGGLRDLLLFPVDAGLQVVLVSKVGNDLAIVVIGKPEGFRQP